MTKETKQHCQQIAERQVKAFDDFIAIIQREAGLDYDTAEKVTNFYLKKKLAKLDSFMGRINVTHGGFLEKQAIENAVAIINA